MLEKLRQCRKKWVVNSTSKLQEHKGLIQFEKLYLNLRSFRWLSPTRNLESSFKPTGLCMLKYELGTGRPKFCKLFLKDNKLLALRVCQSSLFHSEIAYGKRCPENCPRSGACIIFYTIGWILVFLNLVLYKVLLGMFPL